MVKLGPLLKKILWHDILHVTQQDHWSILIYWEIEEDQVDLILSCIESSQG